MAAYDQGPLAKYNSLTDRHLMSYFSNDRMRRHLIKNGLITKGGEVVSDAVYRVRIARREHRRRVRDLIAQAIIHKALEMERSRQIDIRKKIEEIAKIELVRRVRSDCNRLGDEECLSYFNAGDMSLKTRTSKEKHRSMKSQHDYDDGRLPITPDQESRHRLQKILPNEEIETKHLSQLDSLTLGEYAKILEKQDKFRLNKLPYLGIGNEFKHRDLKPPRTKKSSKSAKERVLKKNEEKKDSQNLLLTQEDLEYLPVGEPQSSVVIEYKAVKFESLNSKNKKVVLKHRSSSDDTFNSMRNGILEFSSINENTEKNKSNKVGTMNNNEYSTKNKINTKSILKKKRFKGTCKSARSSQNKAQAHTFVSILFHAPANNRNFDVMVEQQPSGGNTLILYKESITNNTVFQVKSHRHKGFPFSLTFYIDNVKDSRISTCCEYKHKVGKRIGGPTGHFTFFAVEGDNPCFRCLAEHDLEEEKRENKSKDKFADDFRNSNYLSSEMIKTHHWININYSEYLKNQNRQAFTKNRIKYIQRSKRAYKHKKSLRVRMPFVDFYPKSNEQNSSRHESISVRSTSEDRYKSEEEMDSDENYSRKYSESEEEKKTSSRRSHSANSKSSLENETTAGDIKYSESTNREKTPEIEMNNSDTIHDDVKLSDSNNNAAELDKEIKTKKNFEVEDEITVKNLSDLSSGEKEVEIDKSEAKKEINIDNEGNFESELRNSDKASVEVNENQQMERLVPLSSDSSYSSDVQKAFSKNQPNENRSYNSDDDSKEVSEKQHHPNKKFILPINDDSESETSTSDKGNKNRNVGDNHKNGQLFPTKVTGYEPSSSPGTSQSETVQPDQKEYFSENLSKNEPIMSENKKTSNYISYPTPPDKNDRNKEILEVNMLRTTSPSVRLDSTTRNVPVENVNKKEGSIPDSDFKDSNGSVPIVNHPLENDGENVETPKSSSDEEQINIKQELFEVDAEKPHLQEEFKLLETPRRNFEESETIEEKFESKNFNDDMKAVKEFHSDGTKSPIQNINKNIQLDGIDSDKTHFKEESKVDEPNKINTNIGINHIDEKNTQKDEIVKENDLFIRPIRRAQTPDSSSEYYSSSSELTEGTVPSASYRDLKDIPSSSGLTDNERASLKIDIPKDEEEVASSNFNEKLIPDQHKEIESGSKSRTMNDEDIVNSSLSSLHPNNKDIEIRTDHDEIIRLSSTFSSSSSLESDSEDEAPIRVEHQPDEEVVNKKDEDKLLDSSGEEFDVFFANDDITFKKAKDKFEELNHQSVSSLTIRNCELPSYIFNFISNKLESKKDLKKIELSGCEVEISLLKLLAKALDKWPLLETLVISNNVFVDYSLFDLINTLEYVFNNNKINRKLKLFDISNCALQENDFGQIIKMITENTNIETIILDQNQISRTMWQDFKSAMTNNSNTKSVSIRNCVSDASLLTEIRNDSNRDVISRLIVD